MNPDRATVKQKNENFWTLPGEAGPAPTHLNQRRTSDPSRAEVSTFPGSCS